MAHHTVNCTSRTSAPGKLILFGEHAVVYGTTAIAGALSDLRIHVEASITDSGAVIIKIPNIANEGAAFIVMSVPIEALTAALNTELASFEGGTKAQRPDAAVISVLEASLEPTCDNKHMRKAALSPLYLACGIFRPQLLSGQCKGVEITVTKSTLPVAAGLGSSAALSVATAAALLDCWCVVDASQGCGDAGLFGLGARAAARPSTGQTAAPGQAALAAVNDWAYASECLFHGSPSGLDNTVSCMGGALTYSRQPGQAQVSAAPVAGLPPLRLLVANTKVPKETGKLVAGVRVLHDAHPSVIKPIIASIQAISEEVLGLGQARGKGEAGTGAGASASPAPLTSEEYATICRLAKVNHGLLNALGVGHPALDAVVTAAARHGCGAKLTGAGGGGCALVLLPPVPASTEEATSLESSIASLSSELQSGQGCDVFQTAVGGHGLLVHG